MKRTILFLLILGFTLGCISQDPFTSNFNPYAGIFYFSSSRLAPDNANGDGDLFYSFAKGPGSAEFLVNLTGSSAAGDDDDHLCLLDLARFRAYFMSRRTDIGNLAGDLDIFVVPSLGGSIINLSDAGSENGDDFCNGIHEPSGDLIFTSDRDQLGSMDPDIYRVSVSQDEEGNLVAGTLTNLTTLPGDVTTAREAVDHFDTVIGNTLLFSSARSVADFHDVTNDNADFHIFAIDLAGSSNFVNLTQQGSSETPNTSGFFSTDEFCGAVEGFDFVFGLPTVQKLVFSSNQDVGDDSGQQFTYLVDSTLPAGGPFMVEDFDVFVMDPGIPNEITNLSDGTTGDELDFCKNVVARSAPVPGDDGYVGVFISRRISHGTRDANGNWSESLGVPIATPSPTPTPVTNIFMTNLTLQTPGNFIFPVTAGDPALPLEGSGVNQDNRLETICGTTVFFSSMRDDIESNSGGELDIFAVDIAQNTISQILPLTNASSSGDSKDCFLACDTQNGSIIFVSDRTDNGNDHGPSGDSDLFRARYRNADFSLKSRGSVAIENLTDASSGDHFDYADAAFFLSPYCDSNSGILESGINAFQSAFFDPFVFQYFPEFTQDDFGFGLNSNNTVLFTSVRTNPDNPGGDVDIFSQDIPFQLDTPVTVDLVNLTDAGSNLSDDGSDGLEGFIGQ